MTTKHQVSLCCLQVMIWGTSTLVGLCLRCSRCSKVTEVLQKNRTHISKICWIQICINSQTVKMCCNRAKSEGGLWETVPNPDAIIDEKLRRTCICSRFFSHHYKMSLFFFCYLVLYFLVSSILLPSISWSSWKNIHLKSTTGATFLSFNSCSFAELRIATFLKVAFWFAMLKEYHAANKTFWLTQLSILSNSWLYTQPTCTHSWLPIQFSCHKESSALKFSFLLELSHSQVEDGLLHLLSEVERQQRHFNLFTNKLNVIFWNADSFCIS